MEFVDNPENISEAPEDGSPGPEAEGVEETGPTTVDPGNLPQPVDPEPLVEQHEYTRDITTTAATYIAGSAIDTTAIREWLIDEGYPVTGVVAELDADGSSTTGIIRIQTPIVAPDFEVNVTREDEVNGASSSTALPYIAATSIGVIPVGHTYSGALRFEAEMKRASATGDLIIKPNLDGVDQANVLFPADTEYRDVYETYTITAAPAGDYTVAMGFVPGSSGIVTYIRNGEITGTLTSDQPKGTEVPQATWDTYAGVRSQGIVETTIAWLDTDEGAITPSPDQDRLMALWMWLQAHGYDVRQVAVPWMMTAQADAPVSPSIFVSARGAIDPAVSDAFVYSAINPLDREEFRVEWSAVENRTVMTRRRASTLQADQYEFSTPYVFISEFGPPTDHDIREQDIWNIPTANEFYRRINGEWVLLPPEFELTNERSIALGRKSEASGLRSTALGVLAIASGDWSIAAGSGAVASGANASAFGLDAIASGAESTALGVAAIASAQSATAIGQFAAATNSNANAMGTGASASGAAANAYGRSATASGTGAIAVGNQSLADKIGAIAVGNVAQATGINAIATGSNAVASAESSVAHGINAAASAFGAVALGGESDATAAAAVALGYSAAALADHSIAIGFETEIPATSPRSWGIGYSLSTPGSLPDAGTLKANRVRIVRSSGTGQTELMIRSADGTDGVIHAGDDDKLYLNGVAQVQADVMTTRGDLITQSSGGVPARLARGAANQVLTTEAGGLFLQWRDATAVLPTFPEAERVSGSNFAVSSTTATNITGLTFAIGANEVWAFEFHAITFMSSGTGGVRFAVNGPSGAAATAVFDGTTSSTTAFGFSKVAINTLSTAFGTYGTSNGWVHGHGVITNGATAGNVNLQAALGTAGNSALLEVNVTHIKAIRIA